MERRIAFVDVETTGLDPELHEIIELAIVPARLPDLVEGPAYNVLIQPQHIETASSKALEINGYNAEDWQCATTLENALGTAAFLVLDGAMLAGHNVQFDERFLRVAFERCGLPWPDVGYRRLDTMSLAAPLWLSGKSTGASLDAVCKAIGIERPSPHRALADAQACLQVARYMLTRFEWCHPDFARGNIDWRGGGVEG